MCAPPCHLAGGVLAGAMMNADPIANEESIFHAARAFASRDERDSYLANACGEDRALRARIEALLEVYLTEHSGEGPVREAGAALFDQVTQSGAAAAEEAVGA